MEILINVKDKKVLTPLLIFLKAIGVEVIENTKQTFTKHKTNVSALKKLAENGGIKNIDPLLWQKETRADRKLPR
jgi:hypothetical protein